MLLSLSRKGEKIMFKKKHAFTLAEVLITLAIIGVVAALTIPTLWAKIGTIVNSNRKEVIEDRLLEGLNQLNTLDNGMTASQYETTEDFVKALSKYYKMSQICGANDLQNCFPYSTINYTDENGEATANVSDLKTPESFKLTSDEYLAPAGFISAQGTPFIMLLKKDCIMDTGMAMKSIPTSCIQYMYDRNGTNNPNKLGTDIEHSANIGIASAGSASKVEPDGTLDIPIGSYTTYLILDQDYQGGDGSENGLDTCTDTTWDERGSNNPQCSNNRWAAAKKACADAGYELPSKEDLQELYCRAVGTSAYNYSCSTTTLDSTLATKIAEKSSMYYPFWSSSPNGSELVYGVYFDNGSADGYFVDSNGFRVVCLGN